MISRQLYNLAGWQAASISCRHICKVLETCAALYKLLGLCTPNPQRVHLLLGDNFWPRWNSPGNRAWLVLEATADRYLPMDINGMKVQSL